MNGEGMVAYRGLKAPRRDGEAVLKPCWSKQKVLPRQNRARQDSLSAREIQGCALPRLRAMARAELLEQAASYTRRYRDVSTPDQTGEAAIILAGHQPHLVHPGVWFKNFLLAELGRCTGCHAVNLVIDSDLARNMSIRVPGGSLQRPTISSVPLDKPGAQMPYEARPVQDAEVFSTFGDRVAKAISPLIEQPSIRSFWPSAVEFAREHRNLGRALAQARHVLEGQCGLHTLEIPLSTVCQFRSFKWFTLHLLDKASLFRTIHNRSVAEYRRAHKLRNHRYPVPDLDEGYGWTEVPFWLWTTTEPTRRPAFVRRQAGQLVLSDGKQIQLAVELPPGSEPTPAIEQLDGAQEQGIRLRPRALTTTMFARLALGDLFIHGIGGAKYDQVTDAIIQRFLELDPPEYATATATLKLPIARPSADHSDLQRVKGLLRDLYYHPEMHVDTNANTAPLIAEKRRWIETRVPPQRRGERHQGIVRANEALRSMLSARRQQLKDEHTALESQLKKKAILDAREYAFCLFPLESLQNRLTIRLSCEGDAS